MMRMMKMKILMRRMKTKTKRAREMKKLTVEIICSSWEPVPLWMRAAI